MNRHEHAISLRDEALSILARAEEAEKQGNIERARELLDTAREIRMKAIATWPINPEKI
ncbi:MAG: hypothetical protein ACE5Q3_01385 [Alphaproteobacteria bacterium]